jgi:hypothetical protein
VYKRQAGVGSKIKVDRQGRFIDLGDMFVGGPITIISLGLALSNGATVAWSADGSKATLTSASGFVITLAFRREGHLWICKDLNHLRDFVPCHDDGREHDTNMIKINFVNRHEDVPLAAPVTQDERKLRYNARELQKADIAGDYLRRLGYPGPSQDCCYHCPIWSYQECSYDE